MIDTLLATSTGSSRRRRGRDSALAGRVRRRDPPPPGQRRRPEVARPAGGGLDAVRERPTVVFPIHPRGRRALERGRPRRRTRLGSSSRWATSTSCRWSRRPARRHRLGRDPGGDDRAGRPCLTVRTNTERPDHDHPRDEPAGRARATCGDAPRSCDAARPRRDEPPPLWDGQAGERIAEVIEAWLAARPDATR